MSIGTITPQPTELPSWPLYRMSIERYEAMVDSGVFTKRDRLHLINGLLVAKMTKNPPHVVACDLTRAAIDGLSLAGWYTRVGDPVRLPPDSEPEPDVALVRGAIRDYSNHHPEPADVALVVEIADSSLTDDRKMARIYGNAGIAVYWIVNLVDRQIEVCSGPHADGYTACDLFRPGDIVPVVVDGKIVGQIAVDDLLP
jgi:Uma2 family endonuclease